MNKYYGVMYKGTWNRLVLLSLYSPFYTEFKVSEVPITEHFFF